MDEQFHQSSYPPPPSIPLNLQWQQSIQEHVIGCHLLLLQRKALKMSEWSTEKGEELLLRVSTLLGHNKHHQLKMNSPRRAPRVGAVQKIKNKFYFWMVVTENDSGSFCWWVQMRRLNSCFEHSNSASGGRGPSIDGREVWLLFVTGLIYLLDLVQTLVWSHLRSRHANRH